MQNLISLHLSAQDLADLDAALATLRRVFTPFVALQPDDRVEMTKMWPKSRDFCEQTLTLLENNPQIVPPSLGLAEALADRTALEQLRPRLQQLRQLVEKADDTEMALGSDMMAIALEGYRLLDVAGKGEALKSARRELSTRFARKRRVAEAEPA
jgi:hypothetical protein